VAKGAYWHGTETGYTNRGCRCEPCKLAKSSRGKAEYAKRPKKSKAGQTCLNPDCLGIITRKDWCTKHYHENRMSQPGYTDRVSKAIVVGKPAIDGYKYVMYFDPSRGKRVGKLHHRWVMEEHLGRKLERSENVHHINGDRADNRLENLELWNTYQPAGQRVEDKIAWAEHILNLYAPHKLV